MQYKGYSSRKVLCATLFSLMNVSKYCDSDTSRDNNLALTRAAGCRKRRFRIYARNIRSWRLVFDENHWTISQQTRRVASKATIGIMQLGKSVVSHNLKVLQEGCVFSLLDERDNKQLGWSTEQLGVPWVCLQQQPNSCYNTSTGYGVVATLMRHQQYLILVLVRQVYPSAQQREGTISSTTTLKLHN